MDFSWAKRYPDVYKICTLFQLCELSAPLKYNYTPLTGYLQNGPQCGLVALAMIQGNPTNESVLKIFNIAKNNDFTHNGEILSAEYMKILAEDVLGGDYLVKLNTEGLNNQKIKDFLLGGGFVLIPYDTEKDNSPGFLKGHKAHWAVISGGIETVTNFYVLARHGKAKNVCIWSLSILAESNMQLYEFSPDKKLQDIEYKLPKGGISGHNGINGKSVLILKK
ncbi:unnamed protein product [Brassicogethes aeneus]|uniref:Actin maturation protease n=1 Tax=Brassicogethes aeneus TaxID=1431903 RepID=A0A9P0AZ69_BRAAE|nr:unnamed protein product [Brassicogethes aeneus]